MSKKQLSYLFCGILSGVGVFLLILGITQSSQMIAEDDRLFSHMFLTIPGVLAIGSGLLCLTRKNHRSAAGFVITNFFYTLLGGFLIECFVFQFLHFGLSRPQPRLTIPAGLTCLCYGFLFMIFHIVFCVIYGRKKN